VSLSELAHELKRARQAVHVLESRDYLAPERVREVSRQRYEAALDAIIARRASEQIEEAQSLIAAGLQRLEEVLPVGT